MTDYASIQQDQGSASVGSGEFSGVRYRGNSFTAQATDINAIWLQLNSTGSKDLTIEVYAADGSDNPTGSLLGSHTIANASLTTSYTKYTFGTPVTGLTIGNKYIFYYYPTTSGSYSDDYRDFTMSSSNPYSGGVHKKYESGAWVTESGLDVKFRIISSVTTMDYYSEENQESGYAVNGGGTDNQAVGQSITGDGGNLTDIYYNLRLSGSPTGNATAKVYAHSGTFGTSSVPTGAALATSNTFDVSTLTGNYHNYKFTFASPATLTNGTKYVITFEYSGGSTVNTVQVGRDTTSPSHGGNAAHSSNGTSWSASSGRDLIFYAVTSGGGGGGGTSTRANAYMTTNTGFWGA